MYDTDLEKDFGFYSVIVNGACGSVQSDVIRLWVANPMPATLTLQVPDTAVIGQRYQLHVGYVYGYADVTNYRWTFSNANIDFLNDEGPNLHTTWAVFGPVAQTGTVRVSMTHVCGTRSISRQVRVINPKPVPTAIQELGSDSPDEIFLYPNPVKYELTVDNGEMIIKNMKVVDLTGRLMYQTEPNSPVFQLSVRSIPKGTYLIKITTEKSEDTKKIIVSR